MSFTVGYMSMVMYFHTFYKRYRNLIVANYIKMKTLIHNVRNIYNEFVNYKGELQDNKIWFSFLLRYLQLPF